MSATTANDEAASAGPQADIRPLRNRLDPAPLALGAFGTATFLLSWVNTGEINATAAMSAIATAWVFGGIIQIVVGYWEFLNDRLLPAVTFGTYGAFWMSFAIFSTLYVDKVPVAHRGGAVALFLFPWTVVTLYLLIGSLRTNVALVIAFLLVEALLIPEIIGNANGDTTAIKIGGWFGVALAVNVWYIAGAEIINHQFGRTLLPLGRLVRRGA